MTQVNMLEAKTQLSELVKVAQAGGEVIIANRGEPVVRLVPVRKRSKSGKNSIHPGNAGLIAAWLRANPVPEHARRSAAELDADIAEQRGAWD